MRDIKFRGKNIHTNLWEYGSGLRIYGNGDIFMESPYDYYKEYHKLDPETAGQYTGLKDKNGVEIYEGDIVSCLCGTQVFVVKYCEERCGYFFDECVLCGGADPAPECLGNLRNTIEVIGNIYDNQELLEIDK